MFIHFKKVYFSNYFFKPSSKPNQSVRKMSLSHTHASRFCQTKYLALFGGGGGGNEKGCQSVVVVKRTDRLTDRHATTDEQEQPASVLLSGQIRFADEFGQKS